MRQSSNPSLEEMGALIRGSETIRFEAQNRAEVYAFVEAVLVDQEYHALGKKEKGTVRSYVCKMTGLSMPQVTRLIRQHRQDGRVERRRKRRHRFAAKFTRGDVVLLAELDEAHERLSGPATKKILEREYTQFGKIEYQRLAGISVAHLYNLRGRAEYRKRVSVFEKTKPSKNSIAERRRPDPQGKPGYIRIDTVHQGDTDGKKGVYHINAVDAVTQWEVVGCAERISEAYLKPVLEAVWHQFPFKLLGFHSDNGSEYINHRIAKLLNKLMAEFTKSRANRTQDNALVEGKNGAIIRKAIGYEPIAGKHAEAVQKFYTAHFNPYLNYHRPCGFATVTVNERGKRRRVYKAADYATPYEKLKSLPEAAEYLKKGVSFAKLDRIANAMSDTECARKLTAAKAALRRKIRSGDAVLPLRP